MELVVPATWAFLCLLLTIFTVRLLRPQRPLPPGPVGWPLVGAFPLLGRMPHVALAELAKLYGPIMYLKMGTTGTLVASTPDAARTVFKGYDIDFSHRPEVAISEVATYGRRDIVFADYGPRVRLLKKLLHMHMLGSQGFGQWAAVRRGEVGRLLCFLHESSRANTPVRLLETLISTYMNIIGLFTLSRRVFDVTGGEGCSEFRELFEEIMAVAGRFNIGDFIPSIAWMDIQGIRREAKRVFDKYDPIVTKMLEEHKACAHERKGKPDFFDVIMSYIGSADEEERLDDVNDVKAVCFELYLTASDPSTVAIEWALAEMLKNPGILKRSQSEMDQLIGRNRRLEESDIPHLPYLQAVVKETLRKHPPIPLGLPHYTNQACEVNGYHVPKNTRLHLNIWAISRDPDVWENPLEFNPERFITGKGTGMEPFGTHFEFIPFGVGRRMCPSQQGGVRMVEYVLGSMVHAFDWSVPEGVGISMEEEPGLSLRMARALVPVPSPRLAQSVYDCI